LILSFASQVLQKIWTTGDVTLLPNTYVYDVIEIMNLLDVSQVITDLEIIGGYQLQEYKTDSWSVTITMNSIEPIGSITCFFSNGNAHDVDLKEYD
jgi:hypothetical protein